MKPFSSSSTVMHSDLNIISRLCFFPPVSNQYLQPDSVTGRHTPDYLIHHLWLLSPRPIQSHILTDWVFVEYDVQFPRAAHLILWTANVLGLFWRCDVFSEDPFRSISLLHFLKTKKPTPGPAERADIWINSPLLDIRRPAVSVLQPV